MAGSDAAPSAREHLRAGQVIPAHPLALTADRRLDEARQRRLTEYYVASGAGGVAMAVHTTQFAIREAGVGLLRPVLELAAAAARAALGDSGRRFALIAGVCGDTTQANAEAEIAAALGYDAVLVSLGGPAWREASDAELIAHCRSIGETLPVFGFYLQPAVGGRPLGYRFWRELAELPALWAVKIAPFNRYQTLDVVRAITDAGRDDVALYTGNDDNIVADLLTPFPIRSAGTTGVRYMDGGLLGQWAVWTGPAVRLFQRIKNAQRTGTVDPELLTLGAALTDANSAVFDVAHKFAGCIPGIHEVLRRDRLMAGTWCLDPDERLSPGQADEITRVMRAYPDVAAAK